MIKTGYFRIKGASEQMMSYQEFYDRGQEFAMNLKDMADSGKICLYCACREDDRLELSITRNGVIRVKENGLQSLHASFCPRSEEYNRYLSAVEKGIRSTEEGKLLFQIAIPSGIKRESSGGSSESSGEPDPERQRTGLSDMVMAVNSYAWERQTFSVKKALKEAYQKKEPAVVCYKDEKQFTRLFFGVSNDVVLKIRGELCSLSDICYKPDSFFQSDFKEKFFFYARVTKVSEFKEDRKYQYVNTSAIPFIKNKNVCVRIPTQDFLAMKEKTDPEGAHPVMLTGYVRHDHFDSDDGGADWMTLVKGVFMIVTDTGLLVHNDYEAALINYLCSKNLLFVRPYHPLHHFRDEIPFLMVECLKKKNVLVCIADSDKKYEEYSLLSENNPEFDILVVKKDAPPEDVYEELISLCGKKEV